VLDIWEIGSLVVELEEAAKNLVAGERVFPSVGREDGAVEGLMCIGQPGGTLVVEIGEGAVLNLGSVDAWRVEPYVAKANEFTGGVGDRFDTRGSSDSEGSWPGGQGNGKVSNVISELYRGRSSRVEPFSRVHEI